ncbi:HVO_2922 family protein [Halomicrococcus sp. SG-WS-1]|uniref:HVO_2922 family protein n=1 Tax=Halomicrococcus sp. SG-WS-1 TaxID=3439057 RepID=UPI003F7B23E1
MSKATFELYRDEADEWRWRLVHDNGNVIADSGEGYDRKAGARKGIESVQANAAEATVDVLD